MSRLIRPIILSGGSGTRLWPLSTVSRPKQFLELVGEPLLIQALRRLDGLEGLGDPVVVTGAEQVALVVEAASRAEVDLRRILVEPAARNTAPAVIAAALTIDADDVMVVLPADHLITDGETFLNGVRSAVDLARSGALVVFGIAPDRPETGYGYIRSGDRDGEAFHVAGFTEKPRQADAESMLTAGGFMWNSGMFVFTAGTLLEEARAYAPDIIELVVSSLGTATEGLMHLGPQFEEIEGKSIDVAIMESTSRAWVIPLDVGWTDIGSWRALWEVSNRDADGNVMVGDVRAIDVTGSYIYSSGRRVAVAGVDGVVVVETPQEVLVIGLDASQKVKDLLQDG